MKTAILAYVESERDARPDEVVDQVAESLRRGGHEVSILAVHGDLPRLLRRISDLSPDLVFNLLEDFDGGGTSGPVDVAGVLELLGIPFTGGGPGELYITQDKALAKKVLAFDGIRFPDFAVFSKDQDLETGGNLRMPLFVKPLNNDASIGIDDGALVDSTSALMEKVLAIQKELDDSVLAEEYIEGRELYVGILGNRNPTAFPPIEMDFSGLPDGAPKFLDRRAKWDKKSRRYQGTKAVLAELPDELRARVQRVSLDAFRALRVRDYGRVDLRVTGDNEIYVIEVNASCYLEKGSEFATAAKAAGLDFDALVSKIADLALERHRPAGARASSDPRNRS